MGSVFIYFCQKPGGGDAALTSHDVLSAPQYLYHQKQMLTDHRRMESYHAAIINNAEAFKGRTVVDVGTGT